MENLQNTVTEKDSERIVNHQNTVNVQELERIENHLDKKSESATRATVSEKNVTKRVWRTRGDS